MVKSEDGLIRFRCGACFHRMSVPTEHAGKRGQCARCGKTIRIPGNKVKRKRSRPPELIQSGADSGDGQKTGDGESEAPVSSPDSQAAEEPSETSPSPVDRKEREAAAEPKKPTLTRRSHAELVCADCGRELVVDEHGRIKKCPCGSLLTRKKGSNSSE